MDTGVQTATPQRSMQLGALARAILIQLLKTNLGTQ